MKVSFFHSILTNPLAKTFVTSFIGALFFAADQAITTATGNLGSVGSNSTAAAIGLMLAHNVLSYERDRLFGETAAPAAIPKELNPVVLQSSPVPPTAL